MGGQRQGDSNSDAIGEPKELHPVAQVALGSVVMMVLAIVVILALLFFACLLLGATADEGAQDLLVDFFVALFHLPLFSPAAMLAFFLKYRPILAVLAWMVLWGALDHKLEGDDGPGEFAIFILLIGVGIIYWQVLPLGAP